MKPQYIVGLLIAAGAGFLAYKMVRALTYGQLEIDTSENMPPPIDIALKQNRILPIYIPIRTLFQAVAKNEKEKNLISQISRMFRVRLVNI